GKIIVAAFANIMTLPQQRDDLLLRGREIVGTSYLRVDVAQRRSATEHAFHRARVRHDHDVVLVGALRAQSLWRQHTRDLERDILDAQDLAHYVFTSKN